MGGGSDSNNLGRLTAHQNLLLGMTSGVCSKTINYPFLVFKNCVQQGMPLPLQPRKLYRGLPMAQINLGATTAVQFWCVGFFQRQLSGGKKENLTENAEMASAFLGGVASGVPCSFWEITMIQQQRFGGTIIGTPLRLINTFGFQSMFRGMIGTIGREALYTVGMLGICPILQQKLMKGVGMEQNTALAAGALGAAGIAATMSHPFDTVKTCLQGDVEQKKYTNLRQTINLLQSEYGVRMGFFRGLFWRMSLITTTFFLVNKFKQVIAPVMFPAPSEEDEEPVSQ